MADGVRFELTQDCSWPVFKTGVFNRSTTHPQNEADTEKPSFKFTYSPVLSIID